MNIAVQDLPACRHISLKFESGKYKLGVKDTMPIYTYNPQNSYVNEEKLTPGHFIWALSYSKITFSEIPEKYLTREFFLHALSGVYEDVVAYVKAHLGEMFDRDFFKDHIATDKYALEFKNNCFEYMPLEYIDEEMVACAMMSTIGNRLERRHDQRDWFYSVAKRKPEVLTQDFWTLGARLFAEKIGGKNEFLEMTPKEYRTKEYYLAMCLENRTPVMEDIPDSFLTQAILWLIIYDNTYNIQCFSEEALEKTVKLQEYDEELKFWQIAMILDGNVAEYIPLNEERVAFFFKHYDKDSFEYKNGFYRAYKAYKKNLE